MLTAEDATDIKGLRVVITGGTKGIGRATALRLVAAGAKVVIFGRTEDALEDAMRDATAACADGGEVVGLNADQGKIDDVRRVFAEADSKFGGVDVLVNNAGIGAGSVLEMEPDEFHEIIHTNILGYLNAAHEALKRMKAQKRGYIVHIGSMSAESQGKGSDVYVATKAANQGFSASLAKQVAEHGVRVTLIEPGLTGSDMARAEHSDEEQRQMIEKGEMLKAEDIAASVLYCLSQPPRSNVVEIQIRPTLQTD